MSRRIHLNEEELILHLKKTTLPTILVEGDDDSLVYKRYLESRIAIEDVSIFPCGARPKLLKIFHRREEFEKSKVIFVADKDMWFFEGVPEEYEHKIVFTDGYSLENDLYIESFFNTLLDNDEAKKFDDLIKQLSIWFAFEVNRYQEIKEVLCDVHINQICPDNTLSNSFKESINFSDPSEEIIEKIYCQYTRALRGKNLFQALLRFLSHKNRESKYSQKNLLEMGAKFSNPRIDLLVNTIVKKFQEYG
ncbi:DUF4435 domain-containing protein [Pseudanabaena sp. UWO311]|uniref:DUF4435 domain-containing protein n=1 Tax=Pseudanabaena sp. UWO311 TaxID=2487337 RepID=UPI0011585422|nr:DUF4435 domain-containing protein [Pseudanabaena sp. UWO311]TYQ29402.1 DUF4435 domain-containing protein [Pseudanabaena sp. UWO311]